MRAVINTLATVWRFLPYLLFVYVDVDRATYEQ